MATYSATKNYLDPTSEDLKIHLTKPLSALNFSKMDEESRGLMSILVRTLFLLALGAFAVAVVTGLPPLFLAPMFVFAFLSFCLPWRQAAKRPIRAPSGDTVGGT